jgi:hypothetical protein
MSGPGRLDWLLLAFLYGFAVFWLLTAGLWLLLIVRVLP